MECGGESASKTSYALLQNGTFSASPEKSTRVLIRHTLFLYNRLSVSMAYGLLGLEQIVQLVHRLSQLRPSPRL